MEVTNNLFVSTNNETNSSRSSLSVDDFLKIMAAEIRNQNPLGNDSGSNTNYLSQLTQFTTIEQVKTISDNLTLLAMMGQQQYAFTLIGKEVTVADGEETCTGIVDKVKFHNGNPIIEVNNKDYYLSSLIDVSNFKVDGDEAEYEF